MVRKLKVLHVISNFGIGGAEVWLIALLRYYKEHSETLGLEVESEVFLTNGVRDKLDGEAEALGARLIYSRYSRTTLPSFIATWRRTLAAGNYDVIHDHQEFTAGYHFLFGLGHLPQVRIAHLHNPMSHQRSYSSSPLRKKTIAKGNWLLAKIATHLLSTSRQLITEQGFDDLPAARSVIKQAIYCGFDPKRFSGDRSSSRRELLAEFDFPEVARIMLFVGRLDSNVDDALNQKNPSFSLEVARACAEQNPDFVCLVAGGGDAMLAVLHERVRGWGLESRIHLLGARSDVPGLMLGSDLLLFPSLSEGLGMVAVEAQASGLPVIASDGVPKECHVVDGMVDFLSLSAGVDYWADVVLEKMKSTKPNHIAANREVSDSSFSIEKSAKSLLNIYCGQSESSNLSRSGTIRKATFPDAK